MKAVLFSKRWYLSTKLHGFTPQNTVAFKSLTITIIIKYYYNDQINKNGVLCMGEMENAYKYSVGNPEWKILWNTKAQMGAFILRSVVRSSLFWAVTQRMVVAVYRYFETACGSLQGSSTGCGLPRNAGKQLPTYAV